MNEPARSKKCSILQIRLQKDSTTPIGQVITWLNSLDTGERRSNIEQALVMLYFSLSKFDSGASNVEVNRSYWESNNLWHLHQFNLRQILNIPLQENQDSSSFDVDPVNSPEKDTYYDAFGED